jgi:transposase-like protein
MPELCDDEKTVNITLPWNYVDRSLRADSELSFMGEMMDELISETWAASAEKRPEWITAILRPLADDIDTDELCESWNKLNESGQIKPASETETALKLELITLQQQAATMRDELNAARHALRLLRHACESSKAKGITETLKLISKVA